MGTSIFDQLSKLDKPTPAKTSSVRPPEASTSVETAPEAQSPTYQDSQPSGGTTAAQSENQAPENAQMATTRPPDRATGQPADRPVGAARGQGTGRQASQAAGKSAGLPRRRPRHRRIVRHGFELYQDQVDLLRQLSLEAKLTGDDLSMSEMVREAIDEYVTHKNLRPGGGSG